MAKSNPNSGLPKVDGKGFTSVTMTPGVVLPLVTPNNPTPPGTNVGVNTRNYAVVTPLRTDQPKPR